MCWSASLHCRADICILATRPLGKRTTGTLCRLGGVRRGVESRAVAIESGCPGASSNLWELGRLAPNTGVLHYAPMLQTRAA